MRAREKRDPARSEPASPSGSIEPSPRLDANAILALQRTAGNAVVSSLLRTPDEVCEPGDVLLQPVSVSPPRAQLLGEYSDEQVSQELYGRPDIPFARVGPDEVEVLFSSLTSEWKPAFAEHASTFEERTVGAPASDWKPVRDASRGGMVIGYMRGGSYKEVRNTAGEFMGSWEPGLEKVRIPIVDDLVDLLEQAGYVAVGAVDAWLEDNWAALGLDPHERPLATLFDIPEDAVAYSLGRGVGHAVSLLQAAAEIVGGAALIVGGGGATLIGIATTPAGVGLAVQPVGIAAIAAGATVMIHGGALAGAVFMSPYRERGSGGRGRGRGGKGGKGDIKQVDDVAKEVGMKPEQRQEFGDWLEAEKAAGNGGTANERGDFTYRELREKAREFMEMFGE
jgi:hypothetical protein